jgi:DNA-binding beta-propeller fold protein YncE
MKKIIFLFFIFFAKNIFAMSPLDVTNTVSYLSSNRVFHKDNLLVNGFVKFNAGATILSDASAVFSIQFPFAGGLDLRETGTLILQGDLQLDSNFTLSRGGSISGNGQTIFLNEDLRIPDNSIIRITSDTIINGQGNDLIFGRRGRIFVDTNITLTLRNMKIIQSYNDLSDPCIRLAAHKSSLALENIELALSQDFLFPQGQLFIHGDVAVTGTSVFIYQSTQHTFIAPDSMFYLDIGTTFSATPATFTDCSFDQWPTYTSNSFVVMEDKTSRIYFNESSLCTTPTGCRFATGTVNFDNRCSIKSNSALDFTQTYLTDTFLSTQTGMFPACVAYSRDGNYVAVVNQKSDTLQIFDSSTLSQIGSDVTTGTAPISVSWSNTSTQIAVANSGDNTVKTYNFSGGTPTLCASASTGANPSCVAWSLYGKYIAVTNSGSNTLQIFKSDTLAQIGSDATTGNQPSSVSWAPGDKLLAVTNSESNNLQIFSFNYSSTPTQIAQQPTEFAPSSVSWSQNGIFLSVVNKASNSVQIFSFDSTYSLNLIDTFPTNYTPVSTDWTNDGGSLVLVNYTSNTLQFLSFYNQSIPIQIGGNASMGLQPNAVAWSPVANYIATIDQSGVQQLKIFSFDGSSTPVQTGSASFFASQPLSVSWDPTGNYIAIVGGNFLVSGTLDVYSFVPPGGLAPAASVNVGLNPRAVSWSPTSNAIAAVDDFTNELYVYDFIPPATLNLLGSTGAGSLNSPTSVAWDPSGSFIAVVQGVPNHLQIYSFIGGVLTLIGSSVLDSGGNGVCWDPTGQFIAIAVASNKLQICSFNGSGNPVLISTVTTPTGGTPTSVAWSTDGRFLCVTAGDIVSTFAFDGLNTLQQVGSPAFAGVLGSFPISISWNYDSKFIAVANSGTNNLQVYSSLNQANLISPTIQKITTEKAPSSVSCSPDNTKIAVAASDANEIQIFQFQSPDLLTQIGSDVSTTGLDPFTVSWSPNGKFVALGHNSSNTLDIFAINESNSPVLVASVDTGGACRTSWSPCGNFITVVNVFATTLKVFLFDGVSSLTQVGSTINLGGSYLHNAVWSPDGRFIAVTNRYSPGILKIFSFNGINTPTQVGGNVSVETQPQAVTWSPDGRFIAVANLYSDTLQVFSFDGTNTPIQVGSNVPTYRGPTSISWSPDSRFISVCAGDFSNMLQIFSFNGTSTPTQVGENSATFDTPISAQWTPDGKFIAVCCTSALQIFSFDGASSPIAVRGSYPTLNLPSSAGWAPDGKLIAITTLNPENKFKIFKVNYAPDRSPQAISNGVVFGDSALGSDYDATVKLLAGSNVIVDGLVYYDCVN